jgi:pentatricopeptide repeat domain-containing protein 1
MSSLGVQPNVVAYTAAISACGKGGQAAFALDLFQEMKMNNVALNVQCCNTLLWALSKGGDWRQCLLLLEEMESDASMRIKPDADTYRIVMQALRDQEVQKDLTKRLHEGLAQLTAESGKPGTQ